MTAVVVVGDVIALVIVEKVKRLYCVVLWLVKIALPGDGTWCTWCMLGLDW